MGRMEWWRETFAPGWQVLRRSPRALGGRALRYPVGFLGLCLLVAGILILTDVRWAEWPPRFVSWYRFWTLDAAAARNLMLVVFGPLAAAAGLILATVRTAAAHRQAQVAEARLVTERFSKAVEQLGHASLAVRLGGIYALEQIARASPAAYHWPIMETLTAFVRQGEPAATDHEGKESENPESQESKPPRIAADISAAMAVLARRNSDNDPDGRFLDLSGANLADLSLANVEPRNLANARLIAAKLQSSNLRGGVLLDANLLRADLRGAILRGADLRGAYLEEANLRGAVLPEADLGGAYLGGADLRMTGVSAEQLAKANNPLAAKLDNNVCAELEALLSAKEEATD